MHDAISVGEKASLHITVGLIVKKWADLMLEALSEVAIKNPKFRRSLIVIGESPGGTPRHFWLPL